MPSLTIKEVKELLENQLAISDARTTQSLQQVTQSFQQVAKEVDEIVKQIKGVQATVGKLDDKVTSMISAVTIRVSNVEQDVSRIANECSMNKTLALTELYTMDEKKLNLVIFGVPEQDYADGNAARDADIKKVDSIFRFITKDEKKLFTLRYRMGRKQDGKVRPILVRLGSMYDKDHILSQTKVLKDNPQWKDIYVKPDLTKSQREFEKKFQVDKELEAQSKNLLQKNGEDWEWTTRGRGLQCHLSKVKKDRNQTNL